MKRGNSDQLTGIRSCSKWKGGGGILVPACEYSRFSLLLMQTARINIFAGIVEVCINTIIDLKYTGFEYCGINLRPAMVIYWQIK